MCDIFINLFFMPAAQRNLYSEIIWLFVRFFSHTSHRSHYWIKITPSTNCSIKIYLTWIKIKDDWDAGCILHLGILPRVPYFRSSQGIQDLGFPRLDSQTSGIIFILRFITSFKFCLYVKLGWIKISWKNSGTCQLIFLFF